MKLCECECGQPTAIASVTRRKIGQFRGMPLRFIQGHHKDRTRPLSERFYKHVNKDGPMPSVESVRFYPEIAGLACWEWTASKDRKGYGIMRDAGRNRVAHRVAWFMATGKWPEPYGMHKCDNPSCVRFEHLFEGTEQDNTDDMVRKGRQNFWRINGNCRVVGQHKTP